MAHQQGILPVFYLRDLAMEPASGKHKNVRWSQYTATVQLRLPLSGPEWDGIEERDFTVKLSDQELSVKCKGIAGLEDLNGRFSNPAQPQGSWFAIEKDTQDATGSTRVLVVEVAKKSPGEAWSKGIFTKQLFNRQYFGWNQHQQAQDDVAQRSQFVSLQPGCCRKDVDDAFVTSRFWLCSELEHGQSSDGVCWRIILNRKKLNYALEKVPYFSLFGIDVSERYLKLFIRGDETTPVLLGELGGRCVPETIRMELTEVTREVPGHRIVGTLETLPALVVTLSKAPGEAVQWGEVFHNDMKALTAPIGSLQHFQEQRTREPSPDRSDWTPDDWADEQKEKADAAFKEGVYRDAVVYYSRALKHTPLNEKLLSNRSAAYSKINKFQLALDDAVKAQEIEPRWPKIYFRKGQALRGLRQYADAIRSFEEGRDIEPDSPEWEREIQRTKDAEVAWAARKAAKEQR